VWGSFTIILRARVLPPSTSVKARNDYIGKGEYPAIVPYTTNPEGKQTINSKA